MSRASILFRIHLHLAAFSQLGVLSRIVIGRLFSGPCSGTGRWSWAPCVTASGLMIAGDTLFYDFPANVLGSFLIGLFSTGSNLAAIYPNLCATNNVSGLQLPFLPSKSKLQSHGELHIGLRTGYCGSLTTFSSWVMQVVILMVGRSNAPGGLRGTHWIQGLWAIYLGISGPLLGLIVGQHAALAAAALWATVDQASKRQQQLQGPVSHSARKSTTHFPTRTSTAAPAIKAATAGVVMEAVEEPVMEAAGTGRPTSTSTSSPPKPAVVLQVADEFMLPLRCQPVPNPTAVYVATNTPDDAGFRNGQPASLREPKLHPHWLSLASRHAALIMDVAAGAIILTLSGLSLAYAYLHRNNNNAADAAEGNQRFWWFSILLGPGGCFLRWYLSHLNGWRDGWLQYGTFAANILGCVLVFVCEAILFRLSDTLGSTQRMALRGLMVGTAGCLTTVSTYVVEIQKLALSSPPLAYMYFLTSTIAAVLLGVLIYGIPVWLGTR